MHSKPTMKSVLLLSALVLGVSNSSFAEDNESGFFSQLYNSFFGPGVAPVKDNSYREECGACHFPYQPGLLPARSWTKLMAGLDHHFNENAELSAEDNKKLTAYLVNNAADHADFNRSKKIMNSLRNNETPLRITQTPYIIDKHDELSLASIKSNPEVQSLSRCNVCHSKAAEGFFGESDVHIPGSGFGDSDD